MTAQAASTHPQRQHHVERLSRSTLAMVGASHDQGTEYITVDLPNQANAEASVTREYRGRYLFELLQNANDAITAAKQDPMGVQVRPISSAHRAHGFGPDSGQRWDAVRRGRCQ